MIDEFRGDLIRSANDNFVDILSGVPKIINKRVRPRRLRQPCTAVLLSSSHSQRGRRRFKTHAEGKDGKDALVEVHNWRLAMDFLKRAVRVDTHDKELAALLGLAEGAHVADVAEIPATCSW